MKIFINAFIFLFIIAGLFGCKTLPVPKNGIDVEFPYLNGKVSDKRFIIPVHMKPPYLYPLSYISKKGSSKKIIPKKIKEVKIDGVTVYYIAYSPLKLVNKDCFDKIKPGLTLRQIIKILGPGHMYPFSGVGFIYWSCKDERRLFGIITNKLDKKFKFTLQGKSRNHKIVKKLADDLISGMKIYDKKVLIVCTKSTAHAKAGESRFYKINDWISKRRPLPSVEFKIIQIELDGIFCEYSYEALPEDNMRYRETGLIFIKPKPIIEK